MLGLPLEQQVNNVSLADLPKSALDLIELIGMPATIALIEAMPAINFPVPRGEDNNVAGASRFAYLVDAVGDEAARILVSHFNGTDMYVPSCKRAILRARDRKIVADYDAGTSIFELALKYKLSYRSIEMILKRTDTTPVPEDKQADLFG